jgi:hypothetical protein
MEDFADKDEMQEVPEEINEIEKIVITEELDKMEEKIKEAEMLEKKKRNKQY